MLMGLAIGGPLAILTYGSIRDAVQSGEGMNFSLDNFTTDVPPAQLAQVCVVARRLPARGRRVCSADLDALVSHLVSHLCRKLRTTGALRATSSGGSCCKLPWCAAASGLHPGSSQR